MKLVRLYADNTNEFNNTFNAEFTLKPNSQIALLNGNFQKADKELIINSQNDTLSYSIGTYTKTTDALTHQTVDKNNIKSFIEEIEEVLNKSLSVSDGDVNGMAWDVRYNDKGLPNKVTIDTNYGVNTDPFGAMEKDDVIDVGNNIYQKITAAIFTFYINVSSINALYDQVIIYSHFDSFFILYHKFRHKHFGIRNKTQRQVFNVLINFFLTINIISCVLTTIGSVIIIYNSETILDIILNSLALKFIDEIDNMSINKSEIFSFKLIYDQIKGQITENMSFFNSHVPKKMRQVVKLIKKMCLMYFIGCFLSILLYIFTIFAEIWIITCY